ncbi:FAR1 DNA binding domain [Macleaya cordata]|uniref:Protein FAR1-RELATED SEQUENCE n=1 Tax=Macleaya cordata TaxID=56857 RepID=A0A200Q5J0_MACCD|nr:FAR1 DNA binding domain [Macleaya cordata]
MVYDPTYPRDMRPYGMICAHSGLSSFVGDVASHPIKSDGGGPFFTRGLALIAGRHERYFDSEMEDESIQNTSNVVDTSSVVDKCDEDEANKHTSLVGDKCEDNKGKKHTSSVADKCDDNEADKCNSSVADKSDDNEANKRSLDESKINEEPKVGMVFSSQEEVHQYYTNYGLREGFRVTRRSQRCDDDGIMRYYTLACSRSRKSQSTAKNSLKSNLTTKTQCPAKIRSVLQCDGNFKLSTVVLEHNHALCPGDTHHLRCNKKDCPKRRLELNDQVGISAIKSSNFVVEVGGHESLTFGEKKYQNYIDQARRLRLGDGDVEAIRKYFVRMQSKNSSFFYVMDLDEECRVRNLFWADARSRATYEAFGDVVTFDTTYLTNKYAMPFASFVGVNHHGQSVLLGCALLSNEDIGTFVWLFESWLACMSGIPPKAIITDQCQAIQKAVDMVFPYAQHRWCLWHIMKKIPEKLKGCSQYEAIKISLQNAVYESFTKDEFEDEWRNMIDKYRLHDNEWLKGLYDERHHWVPIYMKETFWAGMSTTQRNESMNALFDGYVNSKTTLKQFLEQYDDALRSKVEKENQADYQSFNSRYECITYYDIEKQFQGAYTNTKFKEFQEELKGKLYCYSSLVKEEDSICVYEVTEHVKIGASEKDVVFIVYFNEVECEVKCMCHLFEFRGIICRHALSVLTQRKVQNVPSKYVLSRWRKDLKRKYTFVKAIYDDLGVNPSSQRYHEMCKDFYEVATLATDFEEKYNIVKNGIRELKAKVLGDESICGSNQTTQVVLIASPNGANEKIKNSRAINMVQNVKDNNAKKPRRKKGSKQVVVPPAANQSQMINATGTQDSMNLMANTICFSGSSYVVAPPASNQLHMVNEIGTQESANLSCVSGGNYVFFPPTSTWQGGPTQIWRGGHDAGNISSTGNLN